MGLEHRPVVNDAGAATKQIPSGAHLLGIHISEREIAALHEHGNLERIDAVVLGFPAVNGLHVQGVPQDKVDTVFLA